MVIEIELDKVPKKAVAHPISKGVEPAIEGNKVCFQLIRPTHFWIEIDGLAPLYIYANPLEGAVPSEGDPGVHYFKGGQVYEIGYETQSDSIRNITFRNCDIMTIHGHGAAFSIHNGDRAIVENVLYENIRVEHHYD